MERNPSFLKKKYSDLHTSPEVTSAVKRTESRAKLKNEPLIESRTAESTAEDPSSQEGPLLQEEISTKPEARIQIYLDRFKEISERTDPDKRERGIEAIKTILHKEYIIDPETAADQYIKRQKRIAHEQGHGELNIPPKLQQEVEAATKQILAGNNMEQVLQKFPNEKKQFVEEIVALVEEQKGSLDQWVDYLASPDATYPDWLKYWAMRSIVGLAKYDKDKKVFPKRTEKTANPFPDLNREALAYVLDAIEKKYDGKSISFDQLEEQDNEQVTKLLASENFAKLYAWAMEKLTPASAELLMITKGEWVKFKQGSDALPLTKSLQGHATGWCTAGESVAQSQLSRGDFYVYYSLNEEGKPTIPRAAIRMEDNSIAEVRGIAAEQNLDPYIAPVVQQKMKEFPDGTVYEKKAGDMKQLTSIENKVRLGKELTKDDLIFLHEINGTIEGFGYRHDPRITELRKGRDPKVDAPIVFECAPNEIAWGQKEISDTTKAYVGPLFTGFFEKLSHLEHIYISFPEGKIRRQSIEMTNKTPDQYFAEFSKQGFRVTVEAKYVLEHIGEQTEPSAQKGITTKIKGFFGAKEAGQAEHLNTVRLTIKDLGFTNGATTDEIYKKAEEFGLELCPPAVGPEYRLQYKNQPMDEHFFIAMKQISDSVGGPSVFLLEHSAVGVWLRSRWADLDMHWVPINEFVFRLPSTLRK